MLPTMPIGQGLRHILQQWHFWLGSLWAGTLIFVSIHYVMQHQGNSADVLTVILVTVILLLPTGYRAAKSSLWPPRYASVWRGGWHSLQDWVDNVQIYMTAFAGLVGLFIGPFFLWTIVMQGLDHSLAQVPLSFLTVSGACSLFLFFPLYWIFRWGLATLGKTDQSEKFLQGFRGRPLGMALLWGYGIAVGDGILGFVLVRLFQRFPAFAPAIAGLMGIGYVLMTSLCLLVYIHYRPVPSGPSRQATGSLSL